MRRLVLALTFGFCAVSARASAEPRTAGSRAKVKPTSAKAVSESGEFSYSELVAAADADGDERVSATELESLVHRQVQKQIEARFRRLDRNRDGRVVRDEVPSMLSARFARLDADRDGSFTMAELASVMHGQAAERCRTAFARLDVDRDGELSALDAASTPPTRVSSR
jgi:Ca2+-binding EF-hand superfamily protein